MTILFQFSQNRKLKEKLESTYPKLLVEASPIDFIWGIGCAEDDPDAWDEATWRGKNYLGYILTEVRDELLCDSKFIKEDEKKVNKTLQQDNALSFFMSVCLSLTKMRRVT